MLKLKDVKNNYPCYFWKKLETKPYVSQNINNMTETVKLKCKILFLELGQKRSIWFKNRLLSYLC